MSNQPTWATSKDAVPDGWTQITVYEETTGERIATVYTEAAATLIKAAPELLETLKYILGRLPAHDTKSIAQATAIIAKVEGK